MISHSSAASEQKQYRLAAEPKLEPFPIPLLRNRREIAAAMNDVYALAADSGWRWLVQRDQEESE